MKPKRERLPPKPPQHIVYEPVECPNLLNRRPKHGSNKLGVYLPTGLSDAEVLAAYRAAQPSPKPPPPPQ